MKAARLDSGTYDESQNNGGGRRGSGNSVCWEARSRGTQAGRPAARRRAHVAVVNLLDAEVTISTPRGAWRTVS